MTILKNYNFIPVYDRVTADQARKQWDRVTNYNPTGYEFAIILAKVQERMRKKERIR